MNTLESLSERWLADAGVLEGAFDKRGASLFRLHASQLKEALRESADEVLTLSEASAESGYSESRLRHLIAAGDLPQAGERGRPRVRRGDLPSKPTKNDQSGTESEVDEIVRNIS